MNRKRPSEIVKLFMEKKRVFTSENIKKRKEGVPEIVAVGIYEANDWDTPLPDVELFPFGVYYKIYVFTDGKCHNSSRRVIPKSFPFCNLATKYHSPSELEQACSSDLDEASEIDILCNKCISVKEVDKLVAEEVEEDEDRLPLDPSPAIDWNEVMILRMPYNRLTHTQVIYEKPEYRGIVLGFQKKVVKKFLDDIMEADPMLPEYINVIKRFLEEEKYTNVHFSL